MDTIGERLRSERERLGLSQAAFAELADASKPSQVRYERGDRYPDGLYFQKIAANGADVLFILTGARSAHLAASSEVTGCATEQQRGPINPLLFKFCADIVDSEYSRAGTNLPKIEHFMETVWAYNELIDRLSDPSDGDEIDATLPKVRELLRKRLK